MLVHHRVTPISMSPVPIYTPGWRETMWGKVSCLRKQCDDWALNNQPSDLKSNVLTTTPPCTPPLTAVCSFLFSFLIFFSLCFSLLICSEHLNSSVNSGKARYRDKMKQGNCNLKIDTVFIGIQCSK